MRYCKEVIFAALLFAPCASAQVVVVSAVWNQSLESIKIEGSIDPAIDAIAIEVHATHLAHHSLPDPTVDSVHRWRATVDDYYSYNSRYEGLLDGSTQLNVTVPIRWDPISVNKVVIKEHQPSTVVIDEYLDVSIICPSQGDFSLGAQTTTDCMPETDRQVFLEEEFFDSQGTSVRRLIEPAEWCRLDLAQQRLYWPREGEGDCSVWPQAQIDMSTAANASRQYWEGLGCGDWYKSHTVTFEVEFTEIQTVIRGEAFASLHSPLDDGHIFINSSLAQSGSDDAAGAVLHELTHAAIQFSIFPSAIANQWAAQRLWPEAIATATMIDNQPGSNHFVGLHGPFPDKWADGLAFGRNKARHAALLILYLEENEGFNSCQFMLDNHASLLNGDEIDAFNTEIPLFAHAFTEFVSAYNARKLPQSPILNLPPSIPAKQVSALPDVLYDLSGMSEGDSFQISLPPNTYYLYFEGALRCPLDSVGAVTLLSTQGTSVDTYSVGTSHGVFAIPLNSPPDPDQVITLASPRGDIYMDRLFLSINPDLSFNDFPPSQAGSDPYPSGCQ